ncbi:MAG: sulfite reductase subunit alpha [Chthoniobacterales bacterium]|nr:sulfite reductase subunit alpha [Chthoniobacterales bacterium]
MSAEAPPKPYGRTNPFPARMLVNRRLNPGSEKDTRHFELDLTGWGLSYEVGDSMSVVASNDPALVDEIIQTLGATGDEIVPSSAKANPPLPLREALLRAYSITQLTPKFLRAIAQRASAAPLLKELLDPERKQDLDTYLYGMEVIDFLLDHHSVHFTPEEFVGLLSKLQPRLYSIASSLKMHPDQVHFIIDVVRYESGGRQRKGVCSTFIAERADHIPIPVFPNASKFRLPESADTPIIMVGPGTGIAPFRAFLQERKATGATGRAWLFFGSQREKCDYFYQDEFDQLQSEGFLTKMSCAFSRDQEHKIYVQHRMLENGPELWKWLEAGAHFFVCGDAKRMAKDVDAALHKTIQEQGAMDAERASEYVEKMKQEKRYKRDVY